MTSPQEPPQGPPVGTVPLLVVPCPTHIQVNSERSNDGQLIVSLTIMRPMGTALLVLSSEEAKSLADQIVTAATGLEIPKGPLFVDDILRNMRPPK